MSEKDTNINQKNSDKHKSLSLNNKRKKNKKRFRLLFKILAGLFIVFIIAQILLWFFAKPILKNSITEDIKNKTNGLYTIDFDDIRLNISTRSLDIIGFKLKPDIEIYKKLKKQGKATKALYAINFSKLSIKKLSLYKLLRNKDLEIEKLILQKPLIRLIDLPVKALEKKEKYDAVHKDLYPAISKFLNSITIKEISIEHAYFDFFIQKAESKMASTANNISLKLTNFSLNENAYKKRDRLFYSEKIDIDIQDYILGLKDSIHVLRAKQVSISTDKSEIFAKGVTLLPEQIQDRNLHKLSGSYYKMIVPEIALTGADIKRVYFDKKVKVKKMQFSKPSIKIIKPQKQNINKKKKEKKQYNANDFELYNLIKGKLESIDIDKFVLDSASIQMFKESKIKNPDLIIGSLTLLLDKFQVDSVSKYSKKKIMYANDIALRMNGYNMRLSDKMHWIFADELFLSTKQSQIYAKNVILQPNSNAAMIAQKTGKSLIDMRIPNLLIENINLHKAYNYKDLQIQKLNLSNPDVSISHYRKPDKTNKDKSKKRKKKKIDLYGLTSDYLNNINIGNLQIEDALFYLGEYQNNKQIAYTRGELFMNLDNFTLNKKYYQGAGRFFFADDIDIVFKDYSMMFPNNMHFLDIKEIGLSTKDSVFYIKGVTFKPDDENDIKKQLKKNNKSQYLNLSLDKLELVNADIRKAYFDRRLEISNIKIDNPVINFTKFVGLENAVINDSVTINKLNEEKIKQANLDSIERILNDKDTLVIAKNKIVTNGDTIRIIKNSIVSKLSLNKNKEKIKITISNDIVCVKTQNIRTSQNQDTVIIGRKIIMSKAMLNEKRLSDSLKLLEQDTSYHPYLLANDTITNDSIRKISSIADSIVINKNITINILDTALAKKQLKVEKNDLNEIISNYLDFIKIDSLNLNNGQIHFQKNDNNGRKIMSFNNDFSAVLMKFLFRNEMIPDSLIFLNNNDSITKNDLDKIDIVNKSTKSDTLNEEHRFFFSDDIAVNFKNNFIEFTDKIYDIEVEDIIMSTKKSNIKAKGVKLMPDMILADSLKSAMVARVNIPEIDFNGVDVKQIAFDKNIFLDSITLKNPYITLNQKTAYKKPRKKPNLLKAMPGNFDTIRIGKMQFNTAKLAFIKDNDTSLTSDFSLKINTLNLDSATLTTDTFGIPYIQDISMRLSNFSQKLPDSIHTVKADTIILSVLDSSMSVKNLHYSFNPDKDYSKILEQTKKPFLYNITIPDIVSNGVDFDDYFMNKNAKLSIVTAINLNIEVDYIPKFKKDPTKKFSIKTDTLWDVLSGIKIHQKIIPHFNIFNIDNIVMDNAKIKMNKKFDDSTAVIAYNNLYAKLNNFYIDTLTRIGEDRIIYSDDIDFAIRNYEYKLPDSIYSIKTKEIGISMGNNQGYIDDFVYSTNYKNADLAAKFGYAKSITYIEGKKIELSGLDLMGFIKQRRVTSNLITIDSLIYNSLADKRLPERENYIPELLHNKLLEIKTIFNVDTVKVKRGMMSYQEISKESASMGEFTLKNIKADLINITNDKSLLRNNDTLSVNGQALTMGSGVTEFKLNTRITSPLHETTIDGQLGYMDFTDFNPYIKNTVSVSITKGSINDMDFHIKANDTLAQGDMTFLYRNLKIALHNKETGKVGTGQAISSFLANALIIKKSNLKIKPRIGKIYYKKENEESITKYWIRSILSGVRSTFGFESKDTKEKQKMEKKRANKLEKYNKHNNRIESRRMRKINRQIKKDEQEEFETELKWNKQVTKENKRLKKIRQSKERKRKREIRRENRMERRIRKKMKNLLSLFSCVYDFMT